jgi:hypothetical protein
MMFISDMRCIRKPSSSLRHAEHRTEADQVVEPVAPELDAAEHAPDQAREHQADDGQHQQHGADER